MYARPVYSADTSPELYGHRCRSSPCHAPVGRQAAVYVVVVVINYLACILGVGSGLTALGLEYHPSRLLSGACEAV